MADNHYAQINVTFRFFNKNTNIKLYFVNLFTTKTERIARKFAQMYLFERCVSDVFFVVAIRHASIRNVTMEVYMSEVFYLEGVVQHYDWGGHYFIPELLGKEATAQPTAELWLGVHPKGMGVLRDNQMTLADYLASHGTALPFLLKVLDVRASLSIQVHPDKLQAEQGFARENHAGVALTAAHRNYKDDNHKPEVMVALTPCVLLYGFSEVAQIIQRCQPWPSLHWLVTALQQDPLSAVYRRVMALPADELEATLAPLLRALLPLWRAGELSGRSHLFWLARAASEHGAEACRDPGLLALLMMNLVHVQPGEAIFQPARLPHAYLHGCNVELMANSDNVLRGGLTSKHVDVNELLAVVDVVPVTPLPVAQQALTPGVTRYQLPTDEFHLLRLSCHGGGTLPVLPAVGIALNIGEACVVQLAKRDYPLQQGESVLLPAGQSVVVSGESVDLFVAW